MVVPVYNNAATLQELCRRLRDALPGGPLELIIVDDASTDDSLAVLATLEVAVVRHDRNRGQNAAVLTGLSRARYPFTCVIDADLEDPPESVPRMLSALDPAEVVFSSRDEPHAATSRAFRWIIRRLFPTLPPHPCLCFAITADARSRVIRAAARGDYVPAVIGRLRLRADQIPITRGPRPEARGALTTARRIRYAASAMRAAVRIRLRRDDR